MTKIISIDDMEIEFERQSPEVSCKWCVYIRVRNNDKEKLLFMFKTDHKPRTRFTYNAGELIKNSNQTLKQILDISIDDIEEVIEIEEKSNKNIEE